MPLLLFFIAFALCGCAGSTKVVNPDYSGTRGRVEITHETMTAAVSIDNEYVGSTPLRVSLPPGEHRIVMNCGGKIVFDSTITVSDDYERNSMALRMGGLVAGFASFLLISGPVAFFVAPVVFLAGETGTDFLVDNVHVSSVSGYNAVASVRDSPKQQEEVSGTPVAPVPNQQTSQTVIYANEYVRMYPVPEYGFMVREKGTVKFGNVGLAKSICYDESNDLVWAIGMDGSMNVVKSEDIIPCELDSLPYPTVSSRVKAGTISFLTAVGVWAGIGLAASGGELSTAAIGATVGGLFFGLPTVLITKVVVNRRNRNRCEYLRHKDEVLEWFKQYPCQNTKPTLESKNQ